MKKRIIGNLGEVSLDIQAHSIFELKLFFPEIKYLKGRGKNLKMLCPFHTETSPSFTYEPNKNLFHCFGCGESGSIIHYYAARKQVSFFCAIVDLARHFKILLQFKTIEVEEGGFTF